jgi:hypothetical protein
MSSLSHYYSNAKRGLGGINSVEAVQLGEEFLITGGTGAVLGLIAASKGGSLDMKIAGMNVPIDGLLSFGLGLAGLSIRSKELKIASIAAGGSAATRTFTNFFKKGVGVAGDEISGEDFGFGEHEQFAGSSQYGWGSDASHDRLVEAAKYL